MPVSLDELEWAEGNYRRSHSGSSGYWRVNEYNQSVSFLTSRKIILVTEGVDGLCG